MILINRREAGFAALVLLAAGLTACGDSEADQRKALIQFLQKYIVDKSGAHVPRPTAEDTKSFGPYAEHYAVITDFNAEIDKAMQGPYKISQTNAPRSIQELLDRRADVKAMAAAMSGVAVEMRKSLAEAGAKRAALQQPDDLKVVYSAAYERTVTGPGEGFLATIPVGIDGLQAGLDLADYLDAHRAALKVSGSSLQTNDPKVRADVTKLLNAMTVQNQRLAQAREQFRIAVDGK
jgi:hypothetical protein